MMIAGEQLLMNLTASISHGLVYTTNPQHPHYHKIQIALIACGSYIATALWTTIPPHKGMAIMTLICLISRVTAPYFAQFFEKYNKHSLVVTIGHGLQFSLATLCAKRICYLLGYALSYSQIIKVMIAFVVTIGITQFFLNRYSHPNSHPKSAPPTITSK
jgi:hypothetical protein